MKLCGDYSVDVNVLAFLPRWETHVEGVRDIVQLPEYLDHLMFDTLLGVIQNDMMDLTSATILPGIRHMH